MSLDVIILSDRIIEATLFNYVASNDFYSRLPISVTLEETSYGLSGSIPKGIFDPLEIAREAKIGDICIYDGDIVFVKNNIKRNIMLGKLKNKDDLQYIRGTVKIERKD